MIDRVKIGYLTYDVYEADHVREDGVSHLPDVTDDKWLCGEISYIKRCIYINGVLDEEVKKQTLLHEITHGILRNAGQHANSENEELVDGIAYGLIQVLRDNPQLIEYVTSSE